MTHTPRFDTIAAASAAVIWNKKERQKMDKYTHDVVAAAEAANGWNAADPEMKFDAKFNTYDEAAAKAAEKNHNPWKDPAEKLNPEDATTGLRYNKGKNKLDLIPPEWSWALGLVLTTGAEKYAPRNWELGMPYSDVLGPLERHLQKWKAGERYDVTDADGTPGTGCHHLAVVAWNALALMTYDLREIGDDDVTQDLIAIFDKIQKRGNNVADGEVRVYSRKKETEDAVDTSDRS